MPILPPRMGLKIMQGDNPTFYRDFAFNKTLDHGTGPSITFTRTGTATYFNSAGVLTTAAANEPRFDFDPVTLACRGLLIEEGRTNSIRNSQAGGATVGVIGSGGVMPTNWFPSNLTGFTYEIIGTGKEAEIPYVDVKISGTNSSGGLVYPRVWFESQTQIVATSGQTWTNSFYAKIVDGGIAGLSFMAAQVIENDSSGLNAAQNVTNISLTSSLTRFSHTRTLTQATTTRVTGAILFEVPNGNSCNLTLRIAAPQLERGSFATSYIPTTNAAVTRGADVAVVTPISPFISQSGEETLFSEFSAYTYGATGFFPRIVQLDQDSVGNNNRHVHYLSQPLSKSGADYYNNGINQYGNNTTYSLNTIRKMASGIASNNGMIAINGTLLVGGSNITLVTTKNTHLQIGNNARNTSYLNGHIRKVAYWPKRLPNARLQAITA